MLETFYGVQDHTFLWSSEMYDLGVFTVGFLLLWWDWPLSAGLPVLSSCGAYLLTGECGQVLQQLPPAC